VGIGTSSPTAGYRLQAVSTGGANLIASTSSDASGVTTYMQANGSTAGVFGTLTNHPLSFVTNNTERMRIDSSGNVGIGTSSPTQKLHISGNTLIPVTNTYHCYTTDYGMGTPDSVGLQIFTAAADSIRFGHRTSGTFTERMRIDSANQVLFNKTTAADTTVGSSILSNGRITSTMAEATNAQSTLHVYSTNAAAYRFYVSMNGTINATSTTISAISDIRFKENIRDLDVGLNKIMALKPRLYDWKEGKGADIKNARGFIAQEFEQVFPDLIDEWKDPAPEGEDPYKSVRADLIPVLVKAIQELKVLVDTQASTITTLTDRITALETK
jgi:hypothetical protein